MTPNAGVHRPASSRAQRRCLRVRFNAMFGPVSLEPQTKLFDQLTVSLVVPP
jgi:hypothetical protein